MAESEWVLLGCAGPLVAGEKHTWGAVGWALWSRIAPRQGDVERGQEGGRGGRRSRPDSPTSTEGRSGRCAERQFSKESSPGSRPGRSGPDLGQQLLPRKGPELPQVPPCRHGRGRSIWNGPRSGMAAHRSFPCAAGISKEVRWFNAPPSEAPSPPETWSVFFIFGGDGGERAPIAPTDGVPALHPAARPAEELLDAHGVREVDAWPPYPRLDLLLEATSERASRRPT